MQTSSQRHKSDSFFLNLLGQIRRLKGSGFNSDFNFLNLVIRHLIS